MTNDVAKKGHRRMTLRRTLKRLAVLAVSIGTLAFAAVAFADYSGNYFDP